MVQQTPSLDDLTNIGEEVYFQNKETLEKEHLGEFVVINIETRKLFIDKDKTLAIQKAESKYPGKLFFITQIGSLKEKSQTNFVNGLRISRQPNFY